MLFRSAYGRQTLKVADGNDVEEISRALAAAVADITRPTLILVRTHLGYGSPKQDSFKAHGSPLGADDVAATKAKLGWPAAPDFLVPDAAAKHFLEALQRGEKAEGQWNARMKAYGVVYPDLAKELEGRLAGRLPEGWAADMPAFPAEDRKSTRLNSSHRR